MSEYTGNGNGKGLMVAAIVGAAVGAGAALLYAPRSGKETRRWLAKRGKAIKKQADSAIEQGKSVVRNAASQIGSLADLDGHTSATGAKHAAKSARG